jgi:hypothetical protein
MADTSLHAKMKSVNKRSVRVYKKDPKGFGNLWGLPFMGKATVVLE